MVFELQRKYYAPPKIVYDKMIQDIAKLETREKAYPEVFFRMGVFCEYRWLAMEDYNKGLNVGNFQEYRERTATALRDQTEYEQWKRYTFHPDLRYSTSHAEPYVEPSSSSGLNLFDIAQQRAWTLPLTRRSDTVSQGVLQPKKHQKQHQRRSQGKTKNNINAEAADSSSTTDSTVS